MYTPKIIKLDPTKLVRDSANLAGLLANKRTVSGWEMIEVPENFMFYKGLPMSDSKVLDNEDINNVFAQNHQWLGSPETCYLYAVRGLVNPTDIPVDRCVLGFKTTRTLLLYNLLSVNNMVKMANLKIDDESKKVLRMMTGIGYTGRDIKRITGNSRNIPAQFTEAGKVIKYSVDDNIFSGDAEDFSRTSFYDYDHKIRAILNQYMNCDGYYGYPAPSLFHLNGVFPGEVCIFYPKYTLQLDRDAEYSTTHNRDKLNAVLKSYNYSDRIVKLGSGDVAVSPIVTASTDLTQNIDNLPDIPHQLSDMIAYVLRMRNQIEIPENICKLNSKIC